MKSTEKLTTLTACARAARYLFEHSEKPLKASIVAKGIWPGREMTARGAGGGAVFALFELQRTGVAEWVCSDGGIGWRLTARGLAQHLAFAEGKA